MVVHKPVVVSRTRALLEIVDDGRNGILFEQDNATALADVLERLLHDERLRTKFGCRARIWGDEGHSWRSSGKDFCSGYSKLLQRCEALAT